MGGYCKFCGRRCFLPRAGAQLRPGLILATCPKGMAHDLKMTGYTHRTAINTITGTRDELASFARCNPFHCDTPQVRIELAFLDQPWGMDALLACFDVYDVETRTPVHG